VVRNRPDAALSGLPELLKQRGYQLLWVHPGDQSFYLSSTFYLRRGFKVSDGTSFPKWEPRTNWGYSDKALARHTIALLERAKQPFAAMMLTISNHHPFQLPSDAEPFRLRLPVSSAERERLREDKLIGERTIPMFRTIHYSDEALGYFFAMARTKPWFSQTIFVIVGDHGTPTKPLHDIRSTHELMSLRHRVVMLFYSPLLPGGVRIPGPASQADVLPTLEGLLGSSGPRSGVGVDLLDPADREPQRPIISWNPEARTVTVTTSALSYHGVVGNLGSTPIEFESETLIDPSSDPVGLEDLAEIRPETERLREIARVYVDLYPYLIAAGRTGLPPK
jgi:lipoteichoic acid synthase